MFWRTLTSPRARLPTLPPSRRWRNGPGWRSKAKSQKLCDDANEFFLEKVKNTYIEEVSLSDDELEPDSTEDAESSGGGGVKAPPSFAELSMLFGPLEQYAESCGIREAGHFLLKAKMAFLAARAAKPARQSDIRSFTQS